MVDFRIKYNELIVLVKINTKPHYLLQYIYSG